MSRIEAVAGQAAGQVPTLRVVADVSRESVSAPAPAPPAVTAPQLPSLDTLLSTYKVMSVRPSHAPVQAPAQRPPPRSTPVSAPTQAPAPTMKLVPIPILIAQPQPQPVQSDANKENRDANIPPPPSNGSAVLETLLAELMAHQRQAAEGNQALLQTVVEHSLVLGE